MRQATGFLAGSALLLGLAACGDKAGQTTADATPGATEAAVATAADGKPAAFAQCGACHSVEPGTNGIGPSLHGVTGRKAAAMPGFAYSPALKQSGLTWDAPGLNKWLEDPRGFVPGNKMSYAGLKDPAKRAEVIAYLATLK